MSRLHRAQQPQQHALQRSGLPGSLFDDEEAKQDSAPASFSTAGAGEPWHTSSRPSSQPRMQPAGLGGSGPSSGRTSVQLMHQQAPPSRSGRAPPSRGAGGVGGSGRVGGTGDNSAASAAAAASAAIAAATSTIAALASPSPALLRNSSEVDRRIMLFRARLAAAEASEAYQRGCSVAQLRAIKAHQWRSPFARKDKRLIMMLIAHPSVYPVLSRHLAARMIQRWWHRLPTDVRTRRSRAKAAAAAAHKATWVHPYTAWSRNASASSQFNSSMFRSGRSSLTGMRRAKALSASYYLETGLYHTNMGSKVPTQQYRDWCAAKIARNWLYYRKSARYRRFAVRPLYSYAAIDIQRFWRDYRARRAARTDPMQALHAPARVIQRAYRRFSQRRIYAYFRTLILARQNSNPYLLLRLLNPREGASLAADPASGLYVRFRLGGAVFPPIVYYKTFSSFAVTDIGSFAPRDYARDRKAVQNAVHLNADGTEGSPQPAGLGQAGPLGSPSATVHASQALLHPTDRAFWYRRCENNGWRPIVNDALLAAADPVAERTSAVTKVFHPNKLVRQMDVLRRRKGKKIEWMKKLYASGVVPLPTQAQLDEAARAAAAAGGVDPNRQLDGAAYDSDEEEWRAYKSASAARLPGSGDAGAPSPEALMANLLSLDTSSPDVLLGGGAGGGEWEDEADQLLQWCSGLAAADYEAYNDAWLERATTRPNDAAYRKHEQVTQGHVNTAAGAAAAPVQRAAHPSKPAAARRASPPAAASTNSVPFRSASSLPLPVGVPPRDGQGRALDAQLSQASLFSDQSPDAATDAAAAAAAAHAAAQAQADAEENDELPAWIQQTASRAQLASMASSSAQASAADLARTVSNTSIRNSRSHLSASPSARLATGFEATLPASSSSSKAFVPVQVHVTPAIDAGQKPNAAPAAASPPTAGRRAGPTLGSSQSSLKRLLQHG